MCIMADILKRAVMFSYWIRLRVFFIYQANNDHLNLHKHRYRDIYKKNYTYIQIKKYIKCKKYFNQLVGQNNKAENE